MSPVRCFISVVVILVDWAGIFCKTKSHKRSHAALAPRPRRMHAVPICSWFNASIDEVEPTHTHSALSVTYTTFAGGGVSYMI
ncbi:hypothetical protein BC826DRAFT_1032350, partial [Russula brevipes]